jgi:hypothetical protein
VTWLVLVVSAVVVAINVVVIVRNKRWLRKVQRASGDRDALAQIIYGPRWRGRR